MAASAFDAGRLLRLLVVALVVVSALVGCNGGTVDRHALTNDSATILMGLRRFSNPVISRWSM